MSLPLTPLVIVGAGRSGTNLLRDMLTALPGYETWRCDEIQPIWRHGNITVPHDALRPEHARPEVRRFIREAFERVWREEGRPPVVVEKTCATTLRVAFVASILPEARFVHLVRNGRSVVPSAMKRWRGELEVPSLSYFASKVRYTPLRDLPIYGASFLANRLTLVRGQRRMRRWGPWPEGFEERIERRPLEEVCAMQWAACVTEARAQIADLPSKASIEIAYEDLVRDPVAQLERAVHHAGHDVSFEDIARATVMVRSGSGRSSVPLSPAADAIVAAAAPLESAGAIQ